MNRKSLFVDFLFVVQLQKQIKLEKIYFTVLFLLIAPKMKITHDLSSDLCFENS